jgi:outer membrane protein OmpA-like peptidoglycan-associated protein
MIGWLLVLSLMSPCPAGADMLHRPHQVCATGQRLLTPPIYFETQKDRIRSTSVVDAVAAWLTYHPRARLQIQGHLDRDYGYSNRLSLRRAQGVRNYLINRGIAPERLVADGFGREFPLNANTTLKERAFNRRIEFRLLPSR